MGNGLFTNYYDDEDSLEQAIEDAMLDEEDEATNNISVTSIPIPEHVKQAVALTNFKSGDHILKAHPELIELKRYQIPDKLRFTMPGPQAHTVEEFIDNTVFAAEPIQHVVALGHKLTTKFEYPPVIQHDFTDYCVAERDITFGHYQLSIKRHSGKVVTYEHEHFFHEPIISDVTVTDLNNPSRVGTLHVTLLPVDDGYTLDVNKLKTVILDLHELSKKENILIHCRGGYGRTGHLLFIMQLLDEATRLFTNENGRALARELEKQIDIIRAVNPGYLLNAFQYRDSVYHAYRLHQCQLGNELKPPKEEHFYKQQGAHHFSNFKRQRAHPILEEPPLPYSRINNPCRDSSI